MIKNIYIIRHCEAEGQDSNAPLTKKGFTQANDLVHFLSHINVDKIISSPFLRAVQTIQPFAENKNIKINLDNRLTERVLSTTFLPDWMEKLEVTFTDMDVKFEGGESSNEAKDRIINVVDEIVASDFENTLIVAHGGIISLLLNHYDKSFGFEQWKNLSNPDVYLLTIKKDDAYYKRIWKD